MINSSFVQKDQLPKLYEIVEMKLYPHTVKQLQGVVQQSIETIHNHFISHLNNTLERGRPPLKVFIYTLSNINREQMREKQADAIAYLRQHEDFEYQSALSAVVTPRAGMSTVAYHKPSDSYMVITTAMDIYNIYLTIASLLLKEDTDFVRRASKAVSSRELMEFSDEEQALYQTMKYRRELEQTTQHLATMFSGPDLSTTIDTVKDNIQRTEQALRDYMDRLKELEIKQFYRQHNLNTDASKIKQELIDYLMERENIRVYSVSQKLYVLSKSYLRLGEEARDFFKPEAMENSNHPLYARPVERKLLKDTLDGKILVPIYAEYVIYDSSNGLRIEGSDNYPNEWEDQLMGRSGFVNNHIVKYSCFGGYQQMMRDAYENMDVIGFLEIMEQCTGTINVFDGPVMPGIVTRARRINRDTVIKYKTDTGWEDTTIRRYLNEEDKPIPE